MRWLCVALGAGLLLVGAVLGVLTAGGHFQIVLTSTDVANLEKIMASLATLVGVTVPTWRVLRRRHRRRQHRMRDERERREADEARRAYEQALREIEGDE